MKKIFSLILLSSAVSAYADDCHPQIDENQQNYIVGYGSLINDKSRQRTNPDATNVYPIDVKNFERVWGLRASGSYRGTFLLAVPKESAHLNAVYYPTDYRGMQDADKREVGYCRYKLEPKDIEPLGLKELQKGQYWMYATQPSSIQKPTQNYPMIQSYVDIFINGCMEIQNRYLVSNYVEQCIETTKYWDNDAWINDRVNPRRPTDSTPNATAIDKLLVKKFGDEYYNHKYE